MLIKVELDVIHYLIVTATLYLTCQEAVAKVLKLLDKLSESIEKYPPHEQPQRFGNKAFTDWWLNLRDVS